jgi:uncharacterized protein (DUF1800 family)
MNVRPTGRAFPVRAPTSLVLAALSAALVAGCGGGGGATPDGTATDSGLHSTGGSSGSTSTGSTGATTGSNTGSSTGNTAGSTTGSGTGGTAAATTATHADAWRLLTQASFGPVDADVSKVMAGGDAAWLDAQFALPVSAGYLARWDADNQALQAANPANGASGNSIASQFHYHALKSNDQLRHRVAFALSEIFVVSSVELKGFHSRAIAAYMDMLNRDAFGNYRTLLQDVTLSAAMGQYLNVMGNVKENPTTGQVPDQNYAREVMQLFSIGLSQLNSDGTLKLDGSGHPIDTYAQADVDGLAKVFTGWSWGGPDTSNARFYNAASAQDPNRLALPMQAYPQFHSTSAKSFLGTTIPAQATAQPAADLKTALDAIFNHPNVGPFVGRQLIQRLVTSDPSPAYVARVAAVFNNNGQGVRGDLKAVIRAILLDPEARTSTLASDGNAFGKVREPVLRLTAWMRAFGATSDSGQVLVGLTDDPGLQLGQSVDRSTTVFNFFRPGYVADGSLTGGRDLTMPELQITDETSVAGYVNFMSTAVARGVGMWGLTGTAKRPDVQPNYAAQLALSPQSGPLVDDVTLRLLGDGVPDAYKARLRAAVDSIVIPALKTGGSNQAQVDAAKRNRVNAAVLLTLASPEFIVQK